MPAASQTAYALSPLQQGMLTHHTGASSGAVDLVQIVMHLAEPLSAPAFAQAWQWLAERHGILRTTFHAGEAGQASCQQVHDTVAVECNWQDWRALTPAAREDAWSRLLASDRQRGLDPATAPLWRVTVVQCDGDEHRVIFTFHHLLLDARAVLVLFRELFDAVASFQSGGAPAVGAARPYREYIDWLQAQDFSTSLQYWRKALAGFRTPTPLPLAGAVVRTETSATPGSHDRTLRLDAAHTAALRNFAQDHGCTLNTLVQGAWALLLARYSGETEVVFGAVRACRHASVPGAEQLVGPLINTVPLRVAVPDGVRAADWLRALRRQWVEMRPHEHVALTALRPWTEVPAGARLFETVVSYQEPSWDEALIARGAWANRRFDVHNHTGYPLALDAAGGNTLQLRLTYDPARFGVTAIDRMLGHLATLLDGMADFPDRFLPNLPLLTTQEEEVLLHRWHATPVEFGALECVHDRFARHAAGQPAALAVSDPQRSLSYAELDRAASALAVRLQDQGVGPGVFVGVCVTPSVDLVIALLAVLKAGGAYVPMDPAYPAERLAFMTADAGLRLVVTERKHAMRFSDSTAGVLALDDAHLPASSTTLAPQRASLDDPAYLIYTSGSTGQPKGVPIRHRHLANLVAWHQQAYAVTPADRATQLASPAFDACTWELWPYLAAGASIHIPTADVRVSPRLLVRWLAAERITLTFIPTPLAEATLDENWPADTALRAILTGGDRLRRWPGDRLPCRLFNHYGPTEDTVVATWAPVPAEPDGAATPAIGRPIANNEVYVLDVHRQLVPIGVAGELHLGGAGLADGYHERAELTEEKFVDHPFERWGDRKLYRTGDRVRWREDGQLDYLGRIDQQVKVRGHRIEPGEIEALLNEHPAVRESLVLAREDASHQPQLVAYYLLRAGQAAPAPAALVGTLHRRLPAYMVPVAFVPLEAWPLSVHGKLDRNQLPAPAAAASGAAPQPGLESTIAKVWGEVLGCVCGSSADDFFALGGHSLRAAQVIARLNDALALSLTVRHLFEHSTIAGLASIITQARAATTSSTPSVPESALASQPVA